ncbi:23S rRNA (uracil(747)-C(5))-methyltransferase RlmC [Pasteurella sp. PK-2025]|uniref:23S rRNA (uracil(747)-C(5))-methyltransferase RlmC n=1 Tax=Pasteurella sp. PK-2025 TaxID=3413133 RepID=UPI003C78ADB6
MSFTSSSSALSCPHYQRGDCRSCQWLTMPYSIQLEKKQQHLQQQLQKQDCSQLQWFAPYASLPQAFRNKAKMAVSGMVERPILSHPQSEADLTDCPLYPPHFVKIFTILKDFIARAGLVPYNISKQKGELKYILLTESQLDGGLMLRFVVRSDKKLPLVQRELAGLLAKLPQLKVVSLNIQPQHAAILEGEKEIFLTEQHTLEECFNQIPLFIRPQGFFQTNPQVAQGLYATAQQWVQHLPIHKLWDLFCGVGGFGLHCTQALQAQQPDKTIDLVGIEISASAIEAATLSAQKLGLKKVSFQALDAKHFACALSPDVQASKPDLVIVNPPRRGIGEQLAQFLNQFAPKYLLYSSCNAESMGKDLAHLSHYQLKKIQLFDMFPHSHHYEVLCLLEHQSTQ